MMSIDERIKGHVETIARERGPRLLSAPDAWEIREAVAHECYAETVLDFLSVLRQHNLTLETTDTAEEFAMKVKAYMSGDLPRDLAWAIALNDIARLMGITPKTAALHLINGLADCGDVNVMEEFPELWNAATVKEAP